MTIYCILYSRLFVAMLWQEIFIIYIFTQIQKAKMGNFLIILPINENVQISQILVRMR